MSDLELFNIVKVLGGRRIIDDVSFTVKAGEFFVLLGPSGSGKSTLMRLICGLDKPDSGKIILNGRDITDLPSRERNVGMVFQDYGLYPNMDTYGNIAYGLQARGVKKDEIERRIPPVTEKLKLTHLLHRNIVDLSGGEQQRVALARAMCKDADAYLYDEPLSNLDPKLRSSARRDIQWVHREKGKPSLYVTHDQIEAFALADRIALLGNGRLQQLGSVDNLINSPNNLYVARFVGSPPMNLLEGDIKHQDGSDYFRTSDFEIQLPPHLQSALVNHNKERVILGVRPDWLTYEPGADNILVLQGAVQDMEAMLGETILTARVGANTLVTALLEDDGSVSALGIGDPITLTIDPDRLLLFDWESEEAIRL